MENDSCTCDYSYICQNCSDKIKQRMNAEYAEEVREWTFHAIKAIAEQLNVNLPPAPLKPNYY